MKYMLLIYDDFAAYDKVTEQQQHELFGRYMHFTEELSKSGRMKAGDPLQPPFTSTTVRVVAGKKVATDGPYAETKEQLGGYYIVEAKDVDEATEIASEICKLHTWNSVAVEVRPIMVLPG
ncbi:MAG: YciI family protein [Bryobacter sp.]|nr:YciI family protein [Bryobacter sp.]